MLAFTNTKMTKDEFMANLRAHAEADDIIQGTGFDGQRGCAVGCSLNTYDHSLYPARIGVPIELAYLEDAIFEGLPIEEARKFPLQFGEAIRVGADLSRVHWQFLVWNLSDETYGVKRFSGNQEWGVAAAIDQVSARCARMAVGEPVEDDAWSAARSAASTAMSAAESAAESAAGTARSAAESAASAAESAAWSAAGTAMSAAGTAMSAAWSAESAARSAASAAYISMRDKLLELLAAA